jgi:hypothetical protein
LPPFHQSAVAALPRLSAKNYRETSPSTWSYNCIAWAAGSTDAWWWPAPGRFWPPGVEREETLAAFLEAFATLGYIPCESAELEKDFEKVAIYAVGELPAHAARQMGDGRWTSKLGPNIDIEHETLDALAGGTYGEVRVVLRRAVTPQKLG